MLELGTNFVISQILMFFAMGFDFLSMQFKGRKQIYSILTLSAALISAHLFLLGKITAGIIVFFTVIRFIICIFSTDKRFSYLFIGLNTLTIIFTYSEIYDLIIYTGITIFIVGNFQKNKQLMRKQMMVGTSLFIIYYILIFSPMAILAESLFLSSQILGYYRHYIRKNISKKK